MGFFFSLAFSSSSFAGWLPCFRMWLYLTNSATSLDEPICFFSRVSYYISLPEVASWKGGESRYL